MKKRRISVVDRKVDKRDLPYNSDVAKRYVDDPFAASDQISKIAVTSSLRDDPLGRLYARRQIQQHQFEVGRYVQALFERAEAGHIQAPDPAREYVDGRGAHVDPITDSQLDAVARLKLALAALGERGYALVRDVLCDRIFMADVAQRAGQRSRTVVAFIGQRFREALEDLSYVYGFAGKAPSRRAPHDKFSAAAKCVSNLKEAA